ncbi:hypothetical protein [Streptomyces sp. NPDC006997]|uniref:hypothetical protein n=1 Tax=Streptomyces sp. NPDC006997 TaxID=3155356 RepID=UPI0033C89500
MWISPRPPRRDRRDAPRDTAYGFLSVDEAAYFRARVREAFAERGLEVTLQPTGASDSSGRLFALADLAAVCHHDPRGRRGWARLIHDHVGRLLRVVDGPSPLASLRHADLLAGLRPWVVARDVIEPDAVHHTHARVVAPGLCEVLALDLPESVLPLTDDALAPLGDLAGLRRRALANLGALPVEGHTVLHGAEGARFGVVTGASFFTSSRVLTADRLVRDLTGEALGPDGALVAMPNRYHLALCPVGAVRGAALVPTLHGMAAFAAANFTDAVGPVSPDVYWWHQGVLTRLVRRDGGEPRFTQDAEFEVLLMRRADDGAGERF